MAALLALAALTFLLGRTDAEMVSTAHVLQNGHIIEIIDLSMDGDIVLESLPDVRFSVRGGAVAFVESDCPDQICVRSGFLNRPGQMAACLPNRLALAIVMEHPAAPGHPADMDVDIIAY